MKISDRVNSGGAEITDMQLPPTPVSPKTAGLNPNANVFECKGVCTTPPESSPESQWQQNGDTTSVTPETGMTYVNGDVVTGVGENGITGVTFPPTPESPVTDNTEYVNGNTTLEGQVLFPSEAASPTYSETSVPLEGTIPDDQLKSMLKNQLEYYFSPENLAQDTYLVSQMDGDQYVPIATVAGFNQVKRLTRNLQLVVDVLRGSALVQVDEGGDKVRPIHKRCIVILREVPPSTPVEDVSNLFKGEGCPKFISCEFAHNSNWYVTFETEEDAQLAYMYLREKVQSFLGKPIMARIKAKPVLRSTFVMKNGFKGQAGSEQTAFPASGTTVPTPGLAPSPVSAPPNAALFPTPPAPPINKAGFNIGAAAAPAGGGGGGGVGNLAANSVQYMNTQTNLPFFPPSALPMWPPPNVFFADPGTALHMNGYTPNPPPQPQQQQSSFNKVQKHSFQNNRNRDNNTRNQKGNRFHSGGNQANGRDQSNNHQNHMQSSSHHTDRIHEQPPRHINPRNNRHVDNLHNHHSHSNPNNNGANITGVPRRQELGPHHGGPPPSGGANHHSTHSQGHEVNSSLPGQTNNRPSTQSIDNSHKDPNSLPRREGFRSRRRNINNKSSTSDEDGAKRPTSQSAKDKAHSETFDLEASSFPPLPGSMNNNASGEVFENKMSDVVRGTAKPITKETPAPPPQKAVRENSSETSPAVKSTPQPTKEAKPETNSLPTPPQTPQKSSTQSSSNKKGSDPESTRKQDKPQAADSKNTTSSKTAPKSAPPVATSSKTADDKTTPVTVSAQTPKEDEVKSAPAPAKFSYAAIVQKPQPKDAENASSATKNETEQTSEKEDSDSEKHTTKTRNTLREQQQPRSPNHDSARKDRNEPRDQRQNGRRGAKENRRDDFREERRFHRGNNDRRERERQDRDRPPRK